MEELIMLGSGTGVPSLRRGAPGILLRSGRSIVVIDSGSGTLRRMLEAGITYQDVDLLLYTHIHPDHTADLVPLLFACKYADEPRKKDLLCIGGHGFGRYFTELRSVYGPWITSGSYLFTVKELSEASLPMGDFTITAKPMAHMDESIGYRIDFQSGKSLVISGDTDYCQNIVDLASQADLLVLECSFPEGKKVEGHLTPSLVARIARESRCRKLLITHLYPPCDRIDILQQCKEGFDGDIILGEDLLRIRI